MVLQEQFSNPMLATGDACSECFILTKSLTWYDSYVDESTGMVPTGFCVLR